MYIYIHLRTKVFIYERTNEARYCIYKYTTVRSNKIKLLPKVSHHHILINTFEGNNYKQGIYMYGKCSEVRYINNTNEGIYYVPWYEDSFIINHPLSLPIISIIDSIGGRVLKSRFVKALAYCRTTR